MEIHNVVMSTESIIVMINGKLTICNVKMNKDSIISVK